MKSGSDFLIAARRNEIGELEELASTGELVGAIANLVHGLQRERGLSNVFLGSRGSLVDRQRDEQLADCRDKELAVRRLFDALDTTTGHLRNGTRLFSSIAFVLHALDGLPTLRERISAQQLTPQESTATYVRLINGLLAVVFEAADSASDLQISRALVALFHYMQAKEFSGQERAFGAMLFAAGHAHDDERRHWQHLTESQQRCLQTFADFADPAISQAWALIQSGLPLDRLEALRQVGCALGADAAPNPAQSQAWYDCTTLRVDSMRAVEEQLSDWLRDLCLRRIASAREELSDQQALLLSLRRQAAPASPTLPAITAMTGKGVDRSMMEMVEQQSRRLHEVSGELATVRASFDERKLVERAKGLLMARQGVTEDKAHKTMLRIAMDQNKRLVEVAQSLLGAADGPTDVVGRR